MIINGKPSLACNTFLRDIKGEELILEPLSKFPVIADLVVDRSIIEENLKRAQVYLGELGEIDKNIYSLQYSAAKCLKCGLCLEVCPNYIAGENFFTGCSKALSCEKVCPMDISALSSMLKINRATK